MNKPAVHFDVGVVLSAMGVDGEEQQQACRAALDHAKLNMRMVGSQATRRQLVFMGTHADIAPRAAVKPAAFIGGVCRQQELVNPTVKFFGCSKTQQACAIEAAVTADAAFLVTQDRELLALRAVGQTRMVSPVEFLKAQRSAKAPQTAALLR